MLTGSKEKLLTPPGDKFGNNSSKAQALVEWIKTRLPDLYRPPFDPWDIDRARESRHTLIEIYPAASRKSRQFRRLKWPAQAQDMESIGNTDIADAKRASMTAVCYASTIGLLPDFPACPPVLTPDAVSNSGDFVKKSIELEGWIFTPARGH